MKQEKGTVGWNPRTRNKFPWRPGPLNRIRGWLLSNSFRLPLQVAIAVMLSGFFVYIRPITFPESCIGGIISVAAFVLLAPHPNLGCQLRAACVILFVAAYIPVYIACIASLARTPGSAYTGTFYAFAIVGMVPLAILKVVNIAAGIISLVIYSVVAASVVRIYPLHVIWRDVVPYIMASICVSGAAIIASSCLILTELAGDSLRQTVSCSLQDVGHMLSLLAGTILADNDGCFESTCHQRDLGKKGALEAFSSSQALKEETLIPEELDRQAAFMAAIRDRTDPARQRMQPLTMKIAPPLVAVRGNLNVAKAYIGEVRVLLFLSTITMGIILGLEDLEQSIPVALGYDAKDITRRSSCLDRSRHGPAERLVVTTERPPQQVDIQMTPFTGNGQEGSEELDSSLVGQGEMSMSKSMTEPQDVHVDIGRSTYRKYKKGFLRAHLDYSVKIVLLVLGFPLFRALYQILVMELIRSCSSLKEMTITLKNRNVQYGFKIWLAMSIALGIVLPVNSNYPGTVKYHLYYGLITVAIITVERVEAAAWKTVQRIMGTLLGATLAYLIMLRVFIHNRGAAVLALVCTSLFVVLQGLTTSFTYTFLLTCITLCSLTLCQNGMEHTPGTDWLLWKVRVLDIIAGCCLAIAVSWLILPWYTSNEHLELLGTAYSKAGELVEQLYLDFHKACQAETETTRAEALKEAQTKLKTSFEKGVVGPVEAVLLGLHRDTVYWQKGLLSSPMVVTSLVSKMGVLIRRIQALGMAVLDAPEELGGMTLAMHNLVLNPSHQVTTETLLVLKKLTASCKEILISGRRADRDEEVERLIQETEAHRFRIYEHFQHLREQIKGHSTEAGGNGFSEFSSYDMSMFTSYRLAMAKVSDQMVLIARTLLTEECRRRDGLWSSLFYIQGRQD